MNKPIKSLFENDLVIKIVSILIAVLIWFLVLDQNNPYEERTLSVPLSSNVDVLDDNNLQIIGTQLPASIDVKIKGRRSKITSVTSNDFKALIDLSGVTDSGTKRINISTPQYLGDQDIVVSAYNPTSVNLNFEKMVGKQYPVNVQYKGNLPAGYELMNLKVQPDNVILEEKESSILKVDKVIAELNLSEIKDNKELIIKVMALDSSGQSIKQFEGKVPVIVTFDLVKKVPVVATTVGNPEADYYLKTINYSLPSIRVLGTRAILDGLVKINTEPIDITGKTESFTAPLSLILPDGATALKEDADRLNADIVLDKYVTRSIDLQPSSISIYDGDTTGALEYRVADEPIVLTVRGRQQDTGALKTSDIVLSINVLGLQPGEHTVPLSVKLPSNIALMGEYSVKVVISQAAVQPTPAGTTP